MCLGEINWLVPRPLLRSSLFLPVFSHTTKQDRMGNREEVIKEEKGS